MPEIMEETAKKDSGKHMLIKRNKLIFFAINLLLIASWVLGQYGWGGMVVTLMLMFLWFVYKPDADRPASMDLPLMGILDVCILAILSHQQLMDQFDDSYVSYILDHFEPNIFFILMLATLTMAILFRKGLLGLWLGGLGRAAAGAFFILLLFSDCTLPKPNFYGETDAFFVLYLLCAAGWLIMCAISYYTDTQTLSVSSWLSWLLLIALLAFCLTEASMIPTLASAVQERLLAIPSVGMAWWKVLLAIVVLTGGSVAAYDYDNHKMGPDSLVLGAMACGVLLLRVMISRYSVFNWVLFMVFLVGSFRCLYNELRQTKTLRLVAPVYLVVQMAVLILAIQLLKTGLWILAILLCVYSVVFYATTGKNTTFGYRLFHWLTVLSCPAVLAIGYIWQRCYAIESCILIGVLYAVFAFSILILSWPHPDKQNSPDIYRWVICSFLTLLCLITVTRYGAKIQVTFHEEDNSAVITLEARGKENTVSSAVIYWNSLTGESSGTEKAISAGETIVPILDEKLTIVVTDAYGVTTKVTDWYPKWLLEEKE